MKDHKTVLQEKLQINGEVNIKYVIINEQGPDHDKIFTAEVSCDNKNQQQEKEKQKQAEMEAARIALENMHQEVNYEERIYYTNICSTFGLSKSMYILQSEKISGQLKRLQQKMLKKLQNII